jgi:hypothetical protein
VLFFEHSSLYVGVLISKRENPSGKSLSEEESAAIISNLYVDISSC